MSNEQPKRKKLSGPDNRRLGDWMVEHREDPTGKQKPYVADLASKNLLMTITTSNVNRAANDVGLELYKVEKKRNGVAAPFFQVGPESSVDPVARGKINEVAVHLRTILDEVVAITSEGGTKVMSGGLNRAIDWSQSERARGYSKHERGMR